MGLDIGFVEKTNWNAPRPGPALWDNHLVHFACIQNDEVLTLDEIMSAYESMQERGGYERDDIEQAKAFVPWGEQYWKGRELPAHYGISVTLSY